MNTSEQTKVIFVSVIATILVLSVIVAAFFLGRNSVRDEWGQGGGNKPPTLSYPPSSGMACAQDARMCPDGSSVTRTGPNCEFSPCPSAAK